jgi:hypothetical protein
MNNVQDYYSFYPVRTDNCQYEQSFLISIQPHVFLDGQKISMERHFSFWAGFCGLQIEKIL